MAKQLQMEEEVWDKKRVAVGVSIFVLIIIGVIAAKNYILPQMGFKDSTLPKQEKVSGASTHSVSLPHIALPNTDDVTKKIQSIQEQATHINVSDVASSSPQIQQILQEIQNLPNLPKTVAKQACEQLCAKL